MSYYDSLRDFSLILARDNDWLDQEININVRTLSPQEAIGNPEDRDYPLIKGKERMMEADFQGSKGQAFTDMFGKFSCSMREALRMELSNNFRRAIFVSAINALTRRLGLVEKTVHCRDEKPPECARRLSEYVSTNYGNPKIAIVGLQPRMVETLSKNFEVRVTDMDEDNIGRSIFGTTISGPDQTMSNLEWCDVALVTGTTLTNDSMKEFLGAKPTIFYGVTIAAASRVLGLNRFCPYAT